MKVEEAIETIRGCFFYSPLFKCNVYANYKGDIIKDVDKSIYEEDEIISNVKELKKHDLNVLISECRDVY